MGLITHLRGFCARAYSEQTQARNPFINYRIVLDRSKSPVGSIREAAVQNLLARIKLGQLPAPVILDLLTHPVPALVAAALDQIVEKGVTVEPLYEKPFVAALQARSESDLGRLLNVKTFPANMLPPLLKEDAGLAIAAANIMIERGLPVGRHDVEAFIAALKLFPAGALPGRIKAKTFPENILVSLLWQKENALVDAALDGLTARIKDRTCRPLLLQWVEQPMAERLLHRLDLKAADRSYILDLAITVHHEVRQGVDGVCHSGSATYGQPGHIQTKYTLIDQTRANFLLAEALKASGDSKNDLFSGLRMSTKLGRFLVGDKFGKTVDADSPEPQFSIPLIGSYCRIWTDELI
ncbi:MAG: hypothetical protein MUC35_05455 [Candidatus Margulisbacteria bacterium]|jgi:hypothetical protein|nr:hypothetical protein [Candidatus Margulisiibacteriota bacterium]